MSLDSTFSAGASASPTHDGGFSNGLTPLLQQQGGRQASTIAKSYRQASTLFLTRRLPEALSTILPIITPKTVTDSGVLIEDPPVARTSKSNRVKIWSLYLTILNAIAELEPQEGKDMIGAQDYRAICQKVSDGEIWEEVVRHGYHGMEADVDPEVVINLATLLLAHCGNQIVNQRRLEAYLDFFNSPSTLARRLDTVANSPKPQHRFRSPTRGGGADTPRDLNARIKIIELYTLHVLLRNDEWEKANEYITNSSLLDDERKDAFLQALDSLKEEQADINRQKQEEQRRLQDRLQQEAEDARRQREENERRERQRLEDERQRRLEDKQSNISASQHSATWASSSQRSNHSDHESRASSVPSSRGSRGFSGHVTGGNGKKPVPTSYPFGLTGQAGIVAAQVKGVIDSLSRSLNINVAFLLPIIGTIIAVLMSFANSEIRKKVKQIVATGWAKVKATATMGAKVSSL